MSYMWSVKPNFWANPIRFWHWAARERPQYFWPLVIAGTGPVLVATVIPLRRYFGDDNAPEIPFTYPVPTGPRKVLKGYDDPKPDANSKYPPS